MPPKSVCRLVEFLHPVAVLQDLARFRSVRWTDDTVLFHEIDQASSPAVANSQAALQRGSGSAACVANHANRVLVKIIVNVLATLDIAVGRTFRLAVLVLRRRNSSSWYFAWACSRQKSHTEVIS